MDENTFRIAQMLVPEMPLPSFWRQSAPYFPPSNPTPSPAPSTRMGQWATEWQTPTSQPMEPTFGQSATAALLTAMSAMPAGRGLSMPRPRLSLTPTDQPVAGFRGVQHSPSATDKNFRMMRGEEDLGGISLDVSDPRAIGVNMVENFGGGGPQSLGPSTVRELMGLIREKFPEATSIYGKRVSGARQKAGVPRFAEIDWSPPPSSVSVKLAGRHSEYGAPEYAGKPYFVVRDQSGKMLGEITAESEAHALAEAQRKFLRR
jgi:hypothetical protein